MTRFRRAGGLWRLGTRTAPIASKSATLARLPPARGRPLAGHDFQNVRYEGLGCLTICGSPQVPATQAGDTPEPPAARLPLPATFAGRGRSRNRLLNQRVSECRRLRLLTCARLLPGPVCRLVCRLGPKDEHSRGSVAAIDRPCGAVNRIANLLDPRRDVGVGHVLVRLAEERLRDRLRRDGLDAGRSRLVPGPVPTARSRPAIWAAASLRPIGRMRAGGSD